MLRKSIGLGLCLSLFALSAYSQGLDTRASKDDWEEINFDYNSSVLVDGFPSLLRLAELLDKNPGYKVRIEGHADTIGSDKANERLGLARANSVRDFLIKYGARASQLEAVTRGKTDPKYAGQKNVYSPTDEARWMNRRVALTVTDATGKSIPAGGVPEVIRVIEPAKPAAAPAPMADCCNEVMKRLDKLDDIAKMLKDLTDQNADLKRQVTDLRGSQDQLRAAQQATDRTVAGIPGSIPKPPTPAEVAAEVAKNKDPRFQLLGANIGGTDNGDVTFSGKGRFFAPIGSQFAVQSQGEYMYTKMAKEGQFDLGLVDRFDRHFQAGLFGSFKYVTLSGNQNGGSLGEGAVVFDYIFKTGKIGVFGTKAFLDGSVIDSEHPVVNGMTLFNITNQRYLRAIDQAGVSGTINLMGDNYLEGNLGYLKSVGFGDRFGGTLRLIIPINNKVAFTVEGGVNETLLGRGNNSRAVVGVQFGNMIRPKEFMGATHAVAMDVPRVRYEVLTRTLRTGNNPPVADAGPNMTNVPSGTVTLDGSNSYDPDGDPITYQWVQEAGPSVVLSAPTAARTTFSAALGNVYAFRLTVTDSYGAKSSARVSISTATPLPKPTVQTFLANPQTINRGDTATLVWAASGADTVTISGIGTSPVTVTPTGSQQVSPTQTTTYTLTATNASGSVTSTAVVTVNNPQSKLLYCQVQPSMIVAGQSATISWATSGSDSITIPGVGALGKAGQVQVSPTQTTTYTLTTVASNGGVADTCSLTLTVNNGQAPTITAFLARQASVTSGTITSLLWATQGADTVTISTIGNMAPSGAVDIYPTVTTTYTLTASNKFGSVTQNTTVTVIPPAAGPPSAKIISFTATPNPSSGPGSPVTLTCSATNAISINIPGTVPLVPPIGSFVVRPTVTTTYVCTAFGNDGRYDQASVTVNVPGTNPVTGNGPTINVAGGYLITVVNRYITLDASGSTSSNGPITYNWSSVNNAALILNPSSATPTIQLGNTGDYLFNLTETDSKGNSSTAQVTVRFAQVLPGQN